MVGGCYTLVSCGSAYISKNCLVILGPTWKVSNKKKKLFSQCPKFYLMEMGCKCYVINDKSNDETKKTKSETREKNLALIREAQVI